MLLRTGEGGATAKSGKGFGPDECIKSMKSPWWNGGVGRKSELSNSSLPSIALLCPPSIIGTGMSVVSCSKGELAPPIGPLLWSNSERSASSSRGYIRRVRYEADGGRLLLGVLGLSGPLLLPFACAVEVLIGLVMPLGLRFLFPDLDEGL